MYTLTHFSCSLIFHRTPHPFIIHTSLSPYAVHHAYPPTDKVLVSYSKPCLCIYPSGEKAREREREREFFWGGREGGASVSCVAFLWLVWVGKL